MCIFCLLNDKHTNCIKCWMISFYWFKLTTTRTACHIHNVVIWIRPNLSSKRKSFIFHFSLNWTGRFGIAEKGNLHNYFDFSSTCTHFSLCATLLCFNWPVVNGANEKNVENAARIHGGEAEVCQRTSQTHMLCRFLCLLYRIISSTFT